MARLKSLHIVLTTAVVAFGGLAPPLAAQAAMEPASWRARPVQAEAGTRLYVLNFTDQDIGQVAGQVLGVILQSPFAVDPKLHGRMNLVVEQRLTRAELLAVFKAALVPAGAALVQDGGGWRLVARAVPPPMGPNARRLTTGVHRGDEMVSPALRYAAQAAARPTPSPTMAPAAVFDPRLLSIAVLGGLGLMVLASGLAALRARRDDVPVGKRAGGQLG